MGQGVRRREPPRASLLLVGGGGPGQGPMEEKPYLLLDLLGRVQDFLAGGKGEVDLLLGDAVACKGG